MLGQFSTLAVIAGTIVPSYFVKLSPMLSANVRINPHWREPKLSGDQPYLAPFGFIHSPRLTTLPPASRLVYSVGLSSLYPTRQARWRRPVFLWCYSLRPTSLSIADKRASAQESHQILDSTRSE